MNKIPAYNLLKHSLVCVSCLVSGGKIFICGNGGSAGQAQHFAAELVGRYKHERQALASIALTTDTSAITAIGNDYGFENIFSRQLEALAQEGDVLIALSTSGKSKNVNKAIEWCNQNGVDVIELERIGKDTPEIQENHLRMLHRLAELIEEYFI